MKCREMYSSRASQQEFWPLETVRLEDQPSEGPGRTDLVKADLEGSVDYNKCKM